MTLSLKSSLNSQESDVERTIVKFFGGRLCKLAGDVLSFAPSMTSAMRMSVSTLGLGAAVTSSIIASYAHSQSCTSSTDETTNTKMYSCNQSAISSANLFSVSASTNQSASIKVNLSSSTTVNVGAGSGVFRIYGRASGNVEFSQASSGQDIVALSSVPTAILAANVFDGSGDTSSSVTISATGDISVNSSSDYAVKAFLTKGANLSNSPTKVGTISVTTANITAGGGGIYTRSKGNVTISAGTIVASANHGIRVIHDQVKSGNINITASSITVNSGKWKRAVSLEHQRGAPITISVGVVTHGLGSNTASVYGDGITLRSFVDSGDQPTNITIGSANVGSSAVFVLNTRTGTLSVTATGHIVGRTAVDVFTSGSVNIDLNSFSARPNVSARYAIDVTGESVTVSTSGVIRSRGRAMRLAMSGSATVSTSSLVTTSDVNQTIDVRFFSFASSAGTISISTAGDVTNTHSSTEGTIYAKGNNNTGTRISISTRNVTASGFAAIKVDARNANVDITTSGAVKALGTSSSRESFGIHVRNTGASGQSPTVSINLNSGAVVGTTGKGAILVEAGSNNSPLASKITINSGASLIGSVKLGKGNDEFIFNGGSYSLESSDFGANSESSYSGAVSLSNDEFQINEGDYGDSQTIDGGESTNDNDILNFNSGNWSIKVSNFKNWETLKVGSSATVKILGKGADYGQEVGIPKVEISGVLSLQDRRVGDVVYLEGDLSGTGIIQLDVNFATGSADSIVVQGSASGNLAIKLNDITPTGSAHNVSRNVRLITIPSVASASAFSLEKNFIVAGGYKYRLTVTSGRRIELFGVSAELTCTASSNLTTNTTTYTCNQSSITTTTPYLGTATSTKSANTKVILSSGTSVNFNTTSSFFRIYGRSSGSVTFSQEASGQNIVALSSVPTAILAANVFDGSGDTSSSVTISVTGDISVSNSSDYAVKAFLTKGANLSSSPTKVGNISITTADITAGGGGIYTRSKGNVTITAGAIVASANHGISVNHDQVKSGNINITASSITVNSGKWKRAVSIVYQKGVPITISVGVVTHGLGSNTASIYGDGITLRSFIDSGNKPINVTIGSANVGSSAVIILNTRTGTMSVTATGHIVGRTAVDVFTSGSVNINLNSFSARPNVSASYAIDVRGAEANVSTSGVIRSRGRAMRLAMSGNVTITTSSLVTTSDVDQTIDVRFLSWTSFARTISISTAGDVTNTHGQTDGAIYVQGNSNTGTRISISTGNVTASGFTAIKVNSRNAIVDITTSGAVKALGTSSSRDIVGIHVRNTGSSGQSPTVTINLNSGAVLGTAGKGAILVESGSNNSELASTITINSGASLVGFVKLGRGNDEIKFNGGSFTLGNSQNIDGGAGTDDTLNFNSGTWAVNTSNFSNWETLKVGTGATVKFLGKGASNGQDLTFTSLAISGVLSLQDDIVGDHLDIASNLSGRGVIHVDVDFANKLADQLILTGTSSGNLKLKVNDVTSTNSAHVVDEQIRIITARNLADTSVFSLENNTFTAGGYSYRLTISSGRFIGLQGIRTELACTPSVNTATNTTNYACNQSEITTAIPYWGTATASPTANIKIELSSSTSVNLNSGSGFNLYNRLSGSVTFSQAASGQNIVALSSVPTAILAANVFDGSGDTSSSVTISATGDISVSNSSDYAVKAFLTKGANLSSSPTKVGTISITTADITAGGGGIYTRSKGNVTISAGAIVATANHGIRVNHDQYKSGNINISASSITVNSGKWKRAVSLEYLKGGPVTISVGVVTHGLGSNTASIYGDGIVLRSLWGDHGDHPVNITLGSAFVGSSAVFALNTRTGTLSVMATGHIVGRSAVDVFTSGSVNINLNSFSARPNGSARQAIDVRGGAVTISTSGVIRSRGRAMRLAMSGDVTITTSSLVTTSDVNQTIDVRFLEWISAARTISISTAGDITNTHGQTEGAIYVQGNRNTGTRISISTGNVTASGFAAIKVDSRNANVDITMSGSVEANGTSDSRVANGIHIRNTGASEQSPTVTINLNSGAVLGATGKGAVLVESGSNNSQLASKITINSGASLVGSVKLDRANDELKFNGGGFTLGNSQTIDAGESTNDNDTLIFNSGEFSLIATQFPNWETLKVGTDATVKFLGKGANFGQDLTFTSVVLNGVLSLQDATAGDVLDLAGSLSGNGIIHVDVDFANKSADQISISGNVTGKITIKLNDITPTNSEYAIDEPIRLISVPNIASTNAFSLENDSYTVGRYKYRLRVASNRHIELHGQQSELTCSSVKSSATNTITFTCNQSSISSTITYLGNATSSQSANVRVDLSSSTSVQFGSQSGFFRIYGRASGSVTFSQASNGQNIVALSSVPTAILAANVFDGSGDTSSSVTISATGEISVSNSSDYAVKAFLTKGANLSSSPTKVGTISITTADITAGGGGIYTRSKGNVTISAGAIVATANHGIRVNHDQYKSGNINISASSITVNSGKWKRAVSLEYLKGGPVTISVGVVTHGLGSNTASIYGDGIVLRSLWGDHGDHPVNITLGSAFVGSSAVFALNTRTGTLSVMATGHIVGRSAVDVFTSGSVNINLNSFSARPNGSARQAIDVRGGAVTISTSGVIRSRGRAMRLAMSGDVTITTSSLVTTSDVNQTIDVRFLEWISAARTISISTAGDITNTHGQTEGAIYVQGNRNTGTRISISTGNVTASGFAAIKVDSRNASVNITTSGLVRATGESDSRVANGIHIRNTGASGQSPTVTINLNSGTVIGTTGKGAILVESGNNNSPLASTITINSGASLVGSVKLDRGNDELRFNGGSIRLRGPQTIDGGEGANDNDTLIFNSGNFSLIAKKFLNWETLEIGPNATLKFLGKGTKFGQNLTFSSVVLNGVLSLHDSTAGDVLDLSGNLSGNGTIHIDVDFTENIAKADIITIGGNVSGQHTIKLTSVTPTATIDATKEPITIIDVAGTVSANSFVLENPSFSVLGVDYTLSFDKTTKKFKLIGDDGTLRCDENPSSSGTFVCSGAVNNSGGISKVGSGNVNVNLASSSSVTTSAGVAVSVKGGGSVSFSQGSGSGTISASGSSSGVVHATSTGNGNVSINLNGSANLAGSGTAISASANGTGTVTVNVSGVMASHSGATAIHASGNGASVIVNGGTVSGGKAGVVAKNTSTTGTVVVTMSGKVTSASGTAIYVQNGSSTGTGTGPTGFGALRPNLTLAFNGNSIHRTLNTGRRSVDTNSGEGSVYISVSEAVTSTNSTAIHVHNSGAGDVSIAVASVNGKGMGIYARNDNGGNILITSTGSVTTTGTTLKHAGIYARNDKRGDGITLRVSAASGGVGVHIINNGTGGVSLTATGAIVGTVGDGIAVSNSGNNLSVVAVSVMGSDSGINAVNNGTGNTTIVATGDVVGQRGIGIAVSNISGASAVSLKTSSVTGETSGIRVLNKASGSDTRVNVVGSIVGKTKHGIEVTHENTLGDIDLSVTSVSSNLSAIKVHHAGDANISITTTGKVVASGKDSHGIEAALLGKSGAINVMISSEVVGGAGDGRGIKVETNGQSTNIVLNSGAVVSATSGNAIEIGSGDSTITVNEGSTISGTVELGKGGDTLNLQGGQLSKAIFNGGKDTSVSSSVDNSKDVVNFIRGSFDIAASQFKNFERFNIEQRATVKLSGSQTFSVEEFSIMGTINMMDSSADDSLTIEGNMYGGGVVQLDVDFSMGMSDTLNIAGNVKGITKIKVSDISQKSGSDQHDNITVVTVRGLVSQSNFELADSVVSGGFEYVLNFDQANKTFNLVSHAKGARMLLGVPVALFDGFARPESFHQRRTDQAGNHYRGGKSDLGGWSKLINSNLTYRGAQNDRAEYDINTTGLQLGYDFAKIRGLGGSWIYGITSQYKEVKSGVAINQLGAGESMTAKGYGIGATATYFSENGAYIDIQAQHNSIKTDFPTSTLGQLMNDVESTSLVFSMEIGQRIKVNEAVSVLSYGQVAWGEVDTDYFQTEGSQRVAFGLDGGVTARLGVGGEYQKGRYSVFGLVNVAYDTFNQWNVVYNGEIFWDDVGSTKLELSVGGSLNVDEKATLFIQGGFGLNSSANLSLGTRLSW